MFLNMPKVIQNDFYDEITKTKRILKAKNDYYM